MFEFDKQQQKGAEQHKEVKKIKMYIKQNSVKNVEINSAHLQCMKQASSYLLEVCGETQIYGQHIGPSWTWTGDKIYVSHSLANLWTRHWP